MAHILGFVSFVVILFCTDLFCSAEEDSREGISVPESEHFCTKVMSGRFEHIQLVNIDLFGLFEPDNRMLTCQVVSKEAKDDDQKLEYEYVTEEISLTLNDTYGEWRNNNAFRIDRWFQANPQENGQIRRFYNFLFGTKAFIEALGLINGSGSSVNESSLAWASVKMNEIYMVYTDSALYTWNLRPSFFEGSDKIAEPMSKVTLSKDTPEVALMYWSEGDPTGYTGYAIQKDSQTGNFIIYDFSYDGKSAPKGFWSKTYTEIKNIFRSYKESKLVKPEALKLDSKVYYFMEKTENPHEIRLVHRDHAGANGSSADRQLLGAVPIGFQDIFSLYLFDGSLGCVYVIQDMWPKLTQQFEEGKVDIRLARVNIPYEQYFKCPDKYKLADDFAQRYRGDRCDSVIGEDGSINRGAPIDQDMSTGLFWTLIGLACFLLVTMLVVGMAIFWQKIKPRKIGNKKRPTGPSDLENANKSYKTLTTSGTAK